jgi:3-oxoacyl-[acyl-carrier protein] reductase
MDLNLKGKVALVTGSSKGLGYATALQFAREGVFVTVNSRTVESTVKAAGQIVKETGSKALACPGDLSDANFCAEIVAKTVETYGGLDILVANTGGPPSGKFESLDDDAWIKSFNLLVMSQVRLIRAALPHLKKSGAASVLTLTSYSVKEPVPNLILSNSLRNAVIGITKSLALELGDCGIRFNSILPGWTETERVTDLMTFRAKNNNSTIDEEIKKQASISPFKRLGSPQEFANAAVFLASPAASYITGMMLTVDGGMYKGTF